MASHNSKYVAPAEDDKPHVYRLDRHAGSELYRRTYSTDSAKSKRDWCVRPAENVAVQNESLYDELTTYYRNNPEKSGEWYMKATAVHQRTDSLYNYISSLKQRIVREADGKNGVCKQHRAPRRSRSSLIHHALAHHPRRT